jgi:hypothetical protein
MRVPPSPSAGKTARMRRRAPAAGCNVPLPRNAMEARAFATLDALIVELAKIAAAEDDAAEHAKKVAC